MAEDTNPRIQARISDEMAGWLDNRAELMNNARSRNNQAVTELQLWRTVLESELRKIRLTLAQANCIADVCNGFTLDATVAGSLGLVFAECYDAFRLARQTPGSDLSSYGAKWGLAGCDPAKWEQDLLDYLGGLAPAADHALRDAIARWWDLTEIVEPIPEDATEADVTRFQIAWFERAGLRIIEG